MDVEIIAIGSEVLSGSVTNTNAVFISQHLTSEGFEVKRHEVLPDNEIILREEIDRALSRSPIVITTGGLGPTCDDLTRNIAAAIFDSDFHFDENLASELRQRYGNRPVSINDQATVPSKAKLLKNPIGTAPGMVFQDRGKTLILLPGVPPEMKRMLIEQALPFLRNFIVGKPRYYFQKLFFSGISESMVDPLLRQLREDYPTIEFGIYPGQGVLGITLSVKAAVESEAFKQLKIAIDAILMKFGQFQFISSTGKLEHAIHEQLINKDITLSLAESCTGGNIAAKLTQIPRSSQYFLGSIVAYSNEVKTNVLKVPTELIHTKGAVSQEVARAMCLGALDVMKSDYAMAISGIAGPDGGTIEKPIGTLWCAVGKRGEEPYTWLQNTHGSREMIIERGTNFLLAELYKRICDL